MAQRRAITFAMFVIEIILVAFGVVILAGGFATIALSGHDVNGMAGFNSGLTMILLASVIAVGVGALHFHRQCMVDHSRIFELHSQLLKSHARTEAEMQEIKKTLRILTIAQTARNNAEADELAERRNGRL